MTERQSKAPTTVRKDVIREKAALLNPNGKDGARTMISQSPGGQKEIIIGMAGVDEAQLQTPIGGINVLRVEGSTPKVNGGVLVDLRTSSVQGRTEKRGSVRRVDIGDDGLGAVQVNKRTMLWVQVSPHEPSGIVPESR